MQSRCLFALALHGTGRGRGVPSSLPRTSRTLYAVEVCCLCYGLIALFLLSLVVGTPILLVPTVAPEPLGECVVTLSEAC
jgi:hypothetical protein